MTPDVKAELHDLLVLSFNDGVAAGLKTGAEAFDAVAHEMPDALLSPAQVADELRRLVLEVKK